MKTEIPKTEAEGSDDPRILRQQQRLVSIINEHLASAAQSIFSEIQAETGKATYVEWDPEEDMALAPSFSDEDKLKGLWVSPFCHVGHEDDEFTISVDRIVEFSVYAGGMPYRDAKAFRDIADAIEKEAIDEGIECDAGTNPNYPTRTAQDLEIADLKRENNAAFERIRELSEELVRLGVDPTAKEKS